MATQLPRRRATSAPKRYESDATASASATPPLPASSAAFESFRLTKPRRVRFAVRHALQPLH